MQHALVPCLLATSGVPAHDLSTSSAIYPAGSRLALQALDGRFVKHSSCACWLSDGIAIDPLGTLRLYLSVPGYDMHDILSAIVGSCLRLYSLCV